MKEKVHEEIIDHIRYEFYCAMSIIYSKKMRYISIFTFFFFVLKGSRKRPRLEKGQDAIDADIKKEEDIKSEPKGSYT